MIKAEKVGKINTEVKDVIKPRILVEGPILKRLDHIFSLLQEQNAEIIENYAIKITNRLTKLTEEELGKEFDVKMIDKTNFPYLKRHMGLIESIATFTLNLIKITNEPFDEEVELFERDIFKAIHFNRFHFIEILAELISMEKTKEIYKKHLNLYYETVITTPKFETLDVLRESYIKMTKESGEIRIVSEITDGKLYVRKENCHQTDVLKEFNNPEITSLIVCYQDFIMSKQFNENFAATEKHTLVDGFPYCDMIVHDLRIVNELEQPERAIFDKLYPLNY
ncbi:MAG: L-2-amino-thiazoline-4-carboxylic acid hydrolase [Candidatus Kariarchaeaceae archaeon]|jgi:hypothetical protein